MKRVRRLADFGFICLTAGAIWLVAYQVWPYLGLVAPVGALIALLAAANVADGVWFAARRRRHASGANAVQRPSLGVRPVGRSASAVVPFAGRP